MATVCANTCGDATVLPGRYDLNCAVKTAKIGAEHFFKIKCNEVLDITDATAVAAAILSGVLQASPRGNIVKGRGDEDVIEDAFGCGEDINVSTETTLDYTTYMAECDNVDDNNYWGDINDQKGTYNILYVDCCGKIWADYTSENPGFKTSVSTSFEWVPGDSGLGIWEGQFTLTNPDGKSIRPFYDEAVVSALGISI